MERRYIFLGLIISVIVISISVYIALNKPIGTLKGEQGEQGEQGEPGMNNIIVGKDYYITSAKQDGNSLIFTTNVGTTLRVDNIQGKKGIDGVQGVSPILNIFDSINVDSNGNVSIKNKVGDGLVSGKLNYSIPIRCKTDTASCDFETPIKTLKLNGFDLKQTDEELVIQSQTSQNFIKLHKDGGVSFKDGTYVSGEDSLILKNKQSIAELNKDNLVLSGGNVIFPSNTLSYNKSGGGISIVNDKVPSFILDDVPIIKNKQNYYSGGVAFGAGDIYQNKWLRWHKKRTNKYKELTEERGKTGCVLWHNCNNKKDGEEDKWCKENNNGEFPLWSSCDGGDCIGGQGKFLCKRTEERVNKLMDIWLNDNPEPQIDTPRTDRCIQTGDATKCPNELVSENGQYKMTMQRDGNLVVYKQGTAVWNSNTGNKPDEAHSLIIQSDGHIIIFNPRKLIWGTNVYNKGTKPYTLIMQNDGNLVEYDTNNVVIWSSGVK